MNKFFKIMSVIMFIVFVAATILYFVTGKYYPVSVVALLLFLISAVAVREKK